MSPLRQILYWLSFLPSLVFLGYIIERNVAARRMRPHLAKDEIIYQENFASGCSQKNFLTKIGGASNCLRLIVTRDLLWITSWFPFSLLGPIYDLEHVIPLRRINSVQPTRVFSVDCLLLSFTDETGVSHSVKISPKNRERFVRALQLTEV